MPPKQGITKENVLSAAFEFVRRKGIDELSARAVANSMKCSTQPIYSLYESMDDLKRAVYEKALEYAQSEINTYHSDGYVPILCKAIGYLQFAREERAMFRSLYLSDFAAQYLPRQKMLGGELIAFHAPDSSRLRYAHTDVLDRISEKMSAYLLGIGTMINTGIMELTEDQQADKVLAFYETILAGEHVERADKHSSQKPILGKLIGSGANADVFEYGEGTVVKLFRQKEQYINMINERRNHLVIQQTGLPVPRLLDTVEINGLPGLVYERIDGETVTHKLFTAFDHDDVRLFAQMLHRIHSVPVQQLDVSNLSDVANDLTWQITHGKGLTDAEKASAIAILNSLPKKKNLCHGDLNPNNVIVRESVPYYIDWAGASVGNPEYDVMQLVLIWKYAVIPPEMAPKEFIAEFEQNRNAINTEFLNEYTRLSSLEPEDIDAWFIPVAAAKLNGDHSGQEITLLMNAIRERLARRQGQ